MSNIHNETLLETIYEVDILDSNNNVISLEEKPIKTKRR